MPSNFTGVGESGGIADQPKPKSTAKFTGMKEENITPPTKSTSGNESPAWPQTTQDEKR